MQDRLDLIAVQLDKSITTPQITTPQGKRMLRDLALEIVQGTPQHGFEAEDGQLVAVFNWIKANIEYRQDPEGYDEYRSAGRTLEVRAGDCDDHCILSGAILTSLGFKVGARICSPDEASWHIYTIVGAHPFSSPTVVFPFDTTQPGSYVGWEPHPSQRKYLLQCDFRQGRAVGLRGVK
jgi:hypothetical protein